MTKPIYEIPDWCNRYETNESRKLVNLSWVAIPNTLNGISYRRLSRLKNCSEVFSSFILILEVMSTLPKKIRETGRLIDEYHGPMGAEELSLITGFPQDNFQLALDTLSSPEFGWIKKIENDDDTKNINENEPKYDNLPESKENPVESYAYNTIQDKDKDKEKEKTTTSCCKKEKEKQMMMIFENSNQKQNQPSDAKSHAPPIDDAKKLLTKYLDCRIQDGLKVRNRGGLEAELLKKYANDPQKLAAEWKSFIDDFEANARELEAKKQALIAEKEMQKEEEKKLKKNMDDVKRLLLIFKNLPPPVQDRIKIDAEKVAKGPFGDKLILPLFESEVAKLTNLELLKNLELEGA